MYSVDGALQVLDVLSGVTPGAYRSHIGIRMRLLAAEHGSTAVSLWNDLGDPLFDDAGLAGFKGKLIMLVWLINLFAPFSSYTACFLFLFFLWREELFGIVGWLGVYHSLPALHFTTFFNNNNNNNNNSNNNNNKNIIYPLNDQYETIHHTCYNAINVFMFIF